MQELSCNNDKFSLALRLYVDDAARYAEFLDKLRLALEKRGFVISRSFTSSVVAALRNTIVKIYPSKAEALELWRNGGFRIEVCMESLDPSSLVELVDILVMSAKEQGIRVELAG